MGSFTVEELDDLTDASGEKHGLPNCLRSKLHTSTTPVECLTRVSISNLSLHKTAAGCYLILRTIKSLYEKQDLTVFVEDHLGCTGHLFIYNFMPDEVADVNDFFPPGAIFLLKEPYFTSSKFVHKVLRCDCPTNIIILRQDHRHSALAMGIHWSNAVQDVPSDPVFSLPTPKTAKEWENRGSKLYEMGKLLYAAECYSLACKVATQKRRSCNREYLKYLELCLTMCYFQSGRYELSLEHAKRELRLDPHCRLGFREAGRACYQLRQFKEALRYFDLWHSSCSLEEKVRLEAKMELDRTRQRLLEEEQGMFNVYQLFLASIEKPKQGVDCADYFGPVKLISLQAKGRGIVTTADVQPGTLLVVSKASVVMWFESDASVSTSTLTKHRTELVSAVTQALLKNPQMAFDVYQLSTNNAAFDSSTAEYFCNPETQEEPIVDVDRIIGIVETNAFDLSSNVSDRMSYGNAEPPKCTAPAIDGVGLFIFPSFFNRNCMPNAAWKNYNDVIVIHSTRFIQTGQEVTLSTAKTWQDYMSKELNPKDTCTCASCKLGHQDLVAHRCAHELIHRFESTIQAKWSSGGQLSEHDVQSLEALIQRTEVTYGMSHRNMWRMDLCAMYLLLGFHRCSAKKSEEAINCYHHILRLFGFEPQMLLYFSGSKNDLQFLQLAHLHSIILNVITCLILVHHQDGRHVVMQQWIGVLRILAKLLTGADTNYLKLQFPCIKELLG